MLQKSQVKCLDYNWSRSYKQLCVNNPFPIGDTNQHHHDIELRSRRFLGHRIHWLDCYFASRRVVTAVEALVTRGDLRKRSRSASNRSFSSRHAFNHPFSFSSWATVVQTLLQIFSFVIYHWQFVGRSSRTHQLHQQVYHFTRSTASLNEVGPQAIIDHF